MECLENYVAVTVPMNDRTDILLEGIGGALLNAAGGVSVSDGIGVWRDADGSLVREPHKRVVAWYTREHRVDVARATTEAVRALFRAGEKAVMLEHDNRAYLVYAGGHVGTFVADIFQV